MKRGDILEFFGYHPFMIRNSSFQIELFQMSDGKPYPNDAHSPAMGSSYEPLTRIIWVQLQLTGCRLAARVVMVQMDDALDLGATDFFVWDWKTGNMCMVSRFVLLVRSEPHGTVKGTHSDTKYRCLFHRRVPPLWHSLPRPYHHADAMGYLKPYGPPGSARTDIRTRARPRL